MSMLQRLAGVALQAAVEPLEALSFGERLGAVVPDGWAGSAAAAVLCLARRGQRLLSDHHAHRMR